MVKLISGRRIIPDNGQQAAQQPDQSSSLQRVLGASAYNLGNLIRPGGQTENFEDIFQQYPQLFGTGPTNKVQSLSQLVAPEGVQQPQGTGEELATRFLSTAPLAALGAKQFGQSLPQALTRTAVGAATGTATGSDVGQLLGELGYSGAKAIRGFGKEKQLKYEQAKSILEEKHGKASKGLNEALKAAEKNKLTQTDSSVTKPIDDIVTTIEKNYNPQTKEYNLGNLLEINQSINDQYRDLPKRARPLVNKIKTGIYDTLKNYENPKAWENLSDANKMHMLQVMQTTTSQYLDKALDFVGKAPYVGKIASKIGQFSKILATPEFAYRVAANPAARKYVLKANGDIIKDNLPGFLRNSVNAANILEKETQQEKDQEKPRFKLLAGRRLNSQ